jgi:predicted metal-dependent HD superfamily phosphohydrolase
MTIILALGVWSLVVVLLIRFFKYVHDCDEQQGWSSPSFAGGRGKLHRKQLQRAQLSHSLNR